MKVFTRKKSYIGRKHLRRHSERYLSKLENEFFWLFIKRSEETFQSRKPNFHARCSEMRSPEFYKNYFNGLW